ncbi:telomeric repeat-binding factor 2 [Hyperolius riggenbachi]|uniref:telomeric repeat-binding factor 2 n=1 Tax=Hyperolius riggenbachi TaxID=752182 RepID=UPI0035A33609
MAEGGKDEIWQMESEINQWVLDYMFHLSMEAFRSDRHEDFSVIRDVVSVLIQRPFKNKEESAKILRIMQCLSRVEEGEDIECSFDDNGEETPLESAIEILELMGVEELIEEDRLAANKLMLIEAAVVVCIKHKAFDKARTILNQYLEKNNKTKALRTVLQRVIQTKNLNHSVVSGFSMSSVKQKMYQTFEESIKEVPFFLMTVALKKQQKSEEKGEKGRIPHTEETDSAPPVNMETSDASKTPDLDANARDEVAAPETRAEDDCNPVYSLPELRCAFKSLSNDENVENTFSELSRKVFRKDSSTNADRKRLCTGSDNQAPLRLPVLQFPNPSVSLSRLIMEWDSQHDSICEEENVCQDPSTPPAKTTRSTEHRDPSPSPTKTTRSTVHQDPSPSPTKTTRSTVHQDQTSLPAKTTRSTVHQDQSPSPTKTTGSTVHQDPSPSPEKTTRSAVHEDPSPSPEKTTRSAVHQDPSPSPEKTTRSAVHQDPSSPQAKATRSTVHQDPSSPPAKTTRSTRSNLHQDSLFSSSPAKKRNKIRSESEEQTTEISSEDEVQERWSDEDKLFGEDRQQSKRKSKPVKRQIWTTQESEWIKQGVKIYGEGNMGGHPEEVPISASHVRPHKGTGGEP